MKKNIIYISILFISLFMFSNVKAAELSCCYSTDSSNVDCHANSKEYTNDTTMIVKITQNNNDFETPATYLYRDKSGYDTIGENFSTNKLKFLKNALNENDFKTFILNNGTCPKYAVLYYGKSKVNGKSQGTTFKYWFSSGKTVTSSIQKMMEEKNEYVILTETKGNKINFKEESSNSESTNVKENKTFKDATTNYTVDECKKNKPTVTKNYSDNKCNGLYRISFYDEGNDPGIDEGTTYEKVEYNLGTTTYKDSNGHKLYIKENSGNVNIIFSNGNYDNEVLLYSYSGGYNTAFKDKHNYVWYLDVRTNDLKFSSHNRIRISINYDSEYTTNVGYGEKTSGCNIFGPEDGKFRKYIKWAVTLIRYAVPLLIVVFGITDYLGALFSGEEKNMKEAQKKVIMRVVIGIIALLIPALIKLLVNLSGIIFNTGIDSGDIFCDFL